MDDRFKLVGVCQAADMVGPKPKWYEGKPVTSMFVLGVIAAGCLFCQLFIPKDPAYMDLYHANVAPGREFWFGTDTMGRDIFSMIWHGGRISLFIGTLATLLSTVIGILVGTVSGLAPRWLDMLLMRAIEIFLSIPNLLLVIFLQAVMGTPNVFSIAVVIGITGWTGIAKIVRTEVKQIKNNGYVEAARCMGAGFSRIVRKHLTPNFMPSIMFMVVMNIRGAMVAESTLSFMGMGLPLEMISWGSMLSLADKALLSGSWWIILIPGVFLIITMVAVTNIGNWLQKGKR